MLIIFTTSTIYFSISVSTFVQNNSGFVFPAPAGLSDFVFLTELSVVSGVKTAW